MFKTTSFICMFSNFPAFIFIFSLTLPVPNQFDYSKQVKVLLMEQLFIEVEVLGYLGQRFRMHCRGVKFSMELGNGSIA